MELLQHIVHQLLTESLLENPEQQTKNLSLQNTSIDLYLAIIASYTKFYHEDYHKSTIESVISTFLQKYPLVLFSYHLFWEVRFFLLFSLKTFIFLSRAQKLAQVNNKLALIDILKALRMIIKYSHISALNPMFCSIYDFFVATLNEAKVVETRICFFEV